MKSIVQMTERNASRHLVAKGVNADTRILKQRSISFADPRPAYRTGSNVVLSIRVSDAAMAHTQMEGKLAVDNVLSPV
jgi:hypothetical protein